MEKVFLSSTCYDLTDLRSVLEIFLKDNGKEPLLSDRAYFPVKMGVHRHDVCLNAITQSNMFILVIDGRNGAPYYKNTSISITRAEYREALRLGKSILVFVRKAVYNERTTWKKNKDSGEFKSAYVDDIAIFEFISEIQQDISGLWMQPFDNVLEIIETLKNLVKNPSSIFRGTNGYGFDNLHINKDRLEISYFTKITQGFLISHVLQNSTTEVLTFDKIIEAWASIPSESQIIGPVMDYEIDEFSIPDIIQVATIRPMEDDGSCWQINIFPTALGKTIKNELQTFIDRVSSSQ